MAVYVTFFSPAGIGSVFSPAIGVARATEAVSTGSTSTAYAADGEAMYVMNNEASTVVVAIGSTPNAAATAATSATSAKVAVGAGMGMAFAAKTGDKIAVAVAS